MKFVLAVIVLSFNSMSHAAVTTDISGAFPAYVTCEPSQNLVLFTLKAEENSEFKATELLFKTPVNLVMMDGSPVSAVRLEVCMDADYRNAVFKRIVKRRPSIGAWTAFRYDEITDNSLLPNAGLTAALFQDVSALHMEFVNSKDPKSSFLLQGHTTQDGRKIITLSTFNAKKKNPLAADEYVYGGLFVEGDPFIPKGTRSARVIEINGIKIAFDLMFTGSKGNYLSYDFKSFSVEDSRTGFNYKGIADDPHLKIQYSHHGLSDGFFFNFPDVEYRLTPRNLQIVYKTPAQTEDIKLECDEVHLCGKKVE